MTDLRKAAEIVLEAWEQPYGERGQAVEDAIEALLQVLMQTECCTHDCNEGRDCPLKKEKK